MAFLGSLERNGEFKTSLVIGFSPSPPCCMKVLASWKRKKTQFQEEGIWLLKDRQICDYSGRDMVSERDEVLRGLMQSLEGCGLKESDMASGRDSGRGTRAQEENGDFSQPLLEFACSLTTSRVAWEELCKTYLQLFPATTKWGTLTSVLFTHLPKDYTEKGSRTFLPDKEVR